MVYCFSLISIRRVETPQSTSLSTRNGTMRSSDLHNKHQNLPKEKKKKFQPFGPEFQVPILWEGKAFGGGSCAVARGDFVG